MTRTTRAKECPRCKEKLPWFGQRGVALSRRDSETYICSPCGLAEAMEDLSGRPWLGRPYWNTAKGGVR